MSDESRKFPLGTGQQFESPEPTDTGVPVDRSRNAATIMVTVAALASEPVTAPRAFAAIHPRLVEAAAHGPGVVLGVVGPLGTLVSDLVLRPNQCAMLGRHTSCRVRFEDPGLSLRHLAVHVEPVSGGLRTRVWDLHTSTPFRTEDGLHATAVVADGPLFITVGQYTIGMLAVDAQIAADTDVAWAALPPREFRTQAHADVSATSEPVPDSPRSVRRSSTRITRIPQLSRLVPRTLPTGLLFAQIAIDAGPRILVHDLALEHLRRGVLLGRYERCQAGHHCDESVSRVHLVIVAIGDTVWAIDTASTNGTTLNGDELRSARLTGDDTLSMAGTVLYWRTFAAAAA